MHLPIQTVLPCLKLRLELTLYLRTKDYLPVKQNISVTGKETCVTLVLVNEPIVTAEFEIHKMTFDEIVAAGIDINAAENRNVVKINVTLHYEREPIHSVIY